MCSYSKANLVLSPVLYFFIKTINNTYIGFCSWLFKREPKKDLDVVTFQYKRYKQLVIYTYNIDYQIQLLNINKLPGPL